MSKTVLLAGGTGLVGSRLAPMLQKSGYSVLLLSRRAAPERGIFAWDPGAGQIDLEAVRRADFVINLAGANVADGRWTDVRKKSILDSRVQGARLLADAFRQTGHSPKAYLTASATGFYGNAGEKWMHENDAPQTADFLSKTCTAWEQAADEVATLGIRTVKFRIGIVLATEGGVLGELLKSLRFRIGPIFADGQNWNSWIHRDDLCRMFLWAMENEAASGVFNAVAPNPVRSGDLTKLTAKALRRAAVFGPVPAFLLRLALGEMADIVLSGQRVSADKITAAGFKFRFPELPGALEDLFGK